MQDNEGRGEREKGKVTGGDRGKETKMNIESYRRKSVRLEEDGGGGGGG